VTGFDLSWVKLNFFYNHFQLVKELKGENKFPFYLPRLLFVAVTPQTVKSLFTVINKNTLIRKSYQWKCCSQARAFGIAFKPVLDLTEIMEKRENFRESKQ